MSPSDLRAPRLSSPLVATTVGIRARPIKSGILMPFISTYALDLSNADSYPQTEDGRNR
jgi:hypothetical protein